jgi:hypothetical protein
MISLKFDHKSKKKSKKESDIFLYAGINPLPVHPFSQSAEEYRLRYAKCHKMFTESNVTVSSH